MDITINVEPWVAAVFAATILVCFLCYAYSKGA